MAVYFKGVHYSLKCTIILVYVKTCKEGGPSCFDYTKSCVVVEHKTIVRVP